MPAAAPMASDVSGTNWVAGFLMEIIHPDSVLVCPAQMPASGVAHAPVFCPLSAELALQYLEIRVQEQFLRFGTMHEVNISWLILVLFSCVKVVVASAFSFWVCIGVPFASFWM